MSRPLSRSQAVWLGLLVLATLTLGATGLMALHERAGLGGGGIRVIAGFADIGGVEVGTRVRIQGIDAGEIEAIVPPENPGEPVRLQLRIRAKVRHLVRQDAKVQIANDNLFAGKVVRIVPGSAHATPVEDHGELQADAQPDMMQNLAQATGKLNSVLTRADAVLDSIDKGQGTLGKLVKDELLYKELTHTLAEVKAAIGEFRSGDGTLGKLVKTNDAYAEAMASLQDVRRMVNSVKQNSDAIKALPVVRSYVVDPAKELVRPECKRSRQWFAENDLFEPGKAVLTAKGKTNLDEAGAWLNKQKAPAAEILIASFADPKQNGDFAAAVTAKQSEVVMEYLRNQHQVHRTGWWWWSTRPVRSIGCGNVPSPVPETEKLAAARVEIIVFVP